MHHTARKDFPSMSHLHGIESKGYPQGRHRMNQEYRQGKPKHCCIGRPLWGWSGWSSSLASGAPTCEKCVKLSNLKKVEALNLLLAVIKLVQFNKTICGYLWYIPARVRVRYHEWAYVGVCIMHHVLLKPSETKNQKPFWIFGVNFSPRTLSPLCKSLS